jgi:16S rRNA C967 or C1407 C5-methylase (RsmB/RsmF family)
MKPEKFRYLTKKQPELYGELSAKRSQALSKFLAEDERRNLRSKKSQESQRLLSRSLSSTDKEWAELVKIFDGTDREEQSRTSARYLSLRSFRWDTANEIARCRDELARDLEERTKSFSEYLKIRDQILVEADAIRKNNLPPPDAAYKWIHHSGKAYVVILITNLKATKKEFPRTVVYAEYGEAYGTFWSRPVSEWFSVMKRGEKIKEFAMT